MGKTLTAIATLLASQERCDSNMLRIATIAANGEAVVIGADTFGCVTSDPGPKQFVPGGSANGSITNLAAAINTGNTQDLTAVGIAGVGVLVYSEQRGRRALACSETLAGSNNAWANATMVGGTTRDLDGNLRKFDIVPVTPTATDVAVGQLNVVLGFEPTAVEAFVRDNTGKRVAWDGLLTATGRVVKMDNSGDVDWAATSKVLIIAVG